MARKQTCGPTGDRIDDDEHGGDVVSDGGAMQVVGDEPDDNQERRPA